MRLYSLHRLKPLKAINAIIIIYLPYEPMITPNEFSSASLPSVQTPMLTVASKLTFTSPLAARRTDLPTRLCTMSPHCQACCAPLGAHHAEDANWQADVAADPVVLIEQRRKASALMEAHKNDRICILIFICFLFNSWVHLLLVFYTRI